MAVFVLERCGCVTYYGVSYPCRQHMEERMISSRELEEMQEAEQLLDAILTASQTRLTDTQKTRALTAVDLELAKLRRKWRRTDEDS